MLHSKSRIIAIASRLPVEVCCDVAALIIEANNIDRETLSIKSFLDTINEPLNTIKKILVTWNMLNSRLKF